MMSPEERRGGASVAVLSSFEVWEAILVVNLRLWSSGSRGQASVWNSYANGLPKSRAAAELRSFEMLIDTLASHAHRPLVRHELGCTCVGSDEATFVHLVATASGGDIAEAAKIASLMVTAGHAEHVALLAGQVGAAVREICAHCVTEEALPDNVVRLH